MKFDDYYYEHYLPLHAHPITRRFHFVGVLATALFVWFCLAEREWILLLAAPFIVYPFAWTGHFLFEKNKPAAFKNPIWAKACDWIMFKQIITGKIKW